MMPIAWRFVRMVGVGFGVGATGLAAAVAATGERWWVVALAAVFAPWWLTLAAVLFVLAVVRGWRWGVLGCGGAAVVWAVWYGPLFVPNSVATPSAAEPSRLRVAAFNIGAKRTKWKSLATAIEALDADIVGLEEVSDENAAKLGEAVGNALPHRYLVGGESLGGDATLGMGLLSRYPISPVERLPSSWPGRDSLRTVVTTPAGPITVIVAHPHQPIAVPGINGWTAYRQDPGFAGDIDRLARAATGQGTTLLIGDLNLPERHSAYRTIRGAGLVDVFMAVGHGFGFTWPMERRVHGQPVPALVRIDYLWCTRDVTPERAWVGADDAGSDHRPVVADVRIDR